MAESDVVVVGGGPAGLAVAVGARMAGLSVVLLERRRPPIDQACGEGLMPDAVARLRALEVEPSVEERAPFSGIRYIDSGLSAEGRFAGGPAWGVRRTALHAALVRRAEAVGVALRWGVEVVGLIERGVETSAGAVRGRFVVAADGRHSRVREWSKLTVLPGRRDRHGVRRHFAVAPWSDLVEVYWEADCQAYVTPVGEQRVGVALLWNGAPSSFDRLLERFPALARRLAGAPKASRDLGASRLGMRGSKVVHDMLALVGDASGGVDPITGEGISLALRESAALVGAMVAGDLRLYAAAHRRILRVPRMMAALLLVLERHPIVRRRVVGALAADPELFSRLLDVHVGAAPPSALGGAAAARFAARLVTGVAGAGRAA